MGSTAVFTNTKNDYNRRNTNVSLRARKNLTGRALKSGEFSFTLKEGSRTLQTKTNDASGNVSFDTIEYTSPGTYTYTIEEVKGNDATVTYDTHAARVTVRVTEDSNGNLSASATYDSSSGATFNNTAGKVPPTPTPTPGTPAATPATQATVTPATITPSTVLTSLPSRLAVTADPTAVLPVLALAAVGSAAAIGGLARRRRRK
jgi:pilin isopeptide linkage protein